MAKTPSTNTIVSACHCPTYVGNTGETLSVSPDLYISRDGGITWEQTLAGSWGVNLADHGGLMVAARDYHEEESMELKYSCDEGYSWTDFQFINVRINTCVHECHA